MWQGVAVVDIDTNAISAITSLQRPGKPDLLAKILALFESNSPGMIDEIESGLATADLDAVRAGAHSMKSSAAYLGAVDLTRLCKKIEHAARDGDLESCRTPVAALRDCYEETLLSLHPLVSKAA